MSMGGGLSYVAFSLACQVRKNYPGLGLKQITSVKTIGCWSRVRWIMDPQRFELHRRRWGISGGLYKYAGFWCQKPKSGIHGSLTFLAQLFEPINWRLYIRKVLMKGSQLILWKITVSDRGLKLGAHYMIPMSRKRPIFNLGAIYENLGWSKWEKASQKLGGLGCGTRGERLGMTERWDFDRAERSGGGAWERCCIFQGSLWDRDYLSEKGKDKNSGSVGVGSAWRLAKSGLEGGVGRLSWWGVTQTQLEEEASRKGFGGAKSAGCAGREVEFAARIVRFERSSLRWSRVIQTPTTWTHEYSDGSVGNQLWGHHYTEIQIGSCKNRAHEGEVNGETDTEWLLPRKLYQFHFGIFGRMTKVVTRRVVLENKTNNAVWASVQVKILC